MRRPRSPLFLAGVALAGACAGLAGASLEATGSTAASSTTASSATASSAMPWPTARPDRLATCPDVLVLKPLEGREYLFAAGAQAQTVAFIDAIFFTQKRSYETTFPALRIDRPSEAFEGTFRSAAMTIEAPPGERILAASISSVGTSCGAAHAVSPSLAGIVPQPSLLQVYGRLDAGVAADRPPAGGAIALKPIPGSGPQPCAIPFAAARMNRPTVAVYPEVAREQGAVGTAFVHIDIDALGRAMRSVVYESAGNIALDASATNAATRSSYFPALFECRPDSGAVLFPFDFEIQR